MVLLSTKMCIPPLRPELVARPRLAEQLSAGLSRRLTLLSAPPGFGKTTLLAEWIRTADKNRAVPLGVAWVSLDKGDNDPARFWSYFIAALQAAAPGLGSTAGKVLQSRQSNLKVALTTLINKVATATQETQCTTPHLVVILDDYHLIQSGPVQESLAFLIDHMPPELHVVIASRADPPLRLPRLRGQGQLAELRTDDLRFTSEETATFLNDIMDLRLSAEEIATLEARTEGWIVGLQMAALSLQGRDTEHTAAFISAFAGSHRYVLDYLVEEVLSQQPADVQSFLLQTAVLDRLTPSLCDAVTGQSASKVTLEQMERANLFIVPLDSDRRWYRYHHLFADLLRRKLEESRPDQIAALHRRASEWYEDSGLLAEAIGHTIAADDTERAVQMIEGRVFTMMDCGQSANLADYLDGLPDDAVRSHPWACIARAGALAYAGRLTAVGAALQSAQEAASGLGDSMESQRIAGHVAAIKGYTALLEGELGEAVDLAQDALGFLPDGDLLPRSFATMTLGTSLRLAGELEAATQTYTGAIELCHSPANSHVAVVYLCDLAAVQLEQGHLQRATYTCQKALQISEEYSRRNGRPLPSAGYAHGVLSFTLYLLDDLGNAVQHARLGVDLCRLWGRAEALADVYLYLALALQAVGNKRGALDAMVEAKQLASGVSNWYASLVETFEIRMQLGQGNLSPALRWASTQESRPKPGAKLNLGEMLTYIALVQTLVSEAWFRLRRYETGHRRTLKKDLAEASDRLKELTETTLIQGRIGTAIELFGLRALVLQASGDTEQALVVLERSLGLAKLEGWRQVFVNKGQPMRELLTLAAHDGIEADYANELLAAFGAVRADAAPSASRTVYPEPALTEHLSRREIEVLQHLAMGLSNKEIAFRLTLTVNTVKKHLKNIYGKLNVHSRSRAVARARLLGLLREPAVDRSLATGYPYP